MLAFAHSLLNDKSSGLDFVELDSGQLRSFLKLRSTDRHRLAYGAMADVLSEPPHMDKLQHLLKTAFGQPGAERAPQGPNQFALERELALKETSKKVAALRQMRLARDAKQ
jgi:hypothetical protein